MLHSTLGLASLRLLFAEAANIVTSSQRPFEGGQIYQRA
jgi:hypothetical protein